MSDLVRVSLDMKKSNFDKMRKGHEFQLKKDQLHGSKHELMVKHHNAKKLHTAKRRNKGVRIKLSEDEIIHNMKGEGLKEFLAGLKKAGQWVKSNIIDTPFYQANVKPVVRQVVDTGVNTFGNRFLPAPVTDIAKKGVDLIGQQTGAFGAKKGRKKRSPQQPAGAVAEMIAQSATEPSPIYAPGLFSAYPQPETGSGYSHHPMHHPYSLVKHTYYTMANPVSSGSFRLA